MANTKTYLVYGRNGEELSTLKTLAAAKKLADAEGGSVLCEGECVYKAEGKEADPVEEVVQSVEEAKPVEETQPAEEKAEETPSEKKATVSLQRYKLKTLMNVRKGPTTASAKVRIEPAGTIVEVKEVKNDWLHLTDGTFILYGSGQYAERV